MKDAEDEQTRWRWKNKTTARRKKRRKSKRKKRKRRRTYLDHPPKPLVRILGRYEAEDVANHRNVRFCERKEKSDIKLPP